MTTQIPTIEIAIFAYNAEKNIQKVLKSLGSQKRGKYRILRISVYSDGSTDNTVRLAKALDNPKINIINARKRRGFASSVKKAILATESDLLIMLNDDISISNKSFVANIVKCFHSENDIGLVCSNIVPLPGVNFVEKAVISGFNAYKKTALQFNSGNNRFTCDGKSMTVSKALIKALNLRIPDSNMGNVDLYLYVQCMKLGFKYRFARDSVLYFKCPSTSSDFIQWQIRNYLTHQMFYKKHSELAQTELHLPVVAFIINRCAEFIRNPMGSVYIYVLGLVCTFKSLRYDSRFNPKWETILSSKE